MLTDCESRNGPSWDGLPRMLEGARIAVASPASHSYLSETVRRQGQHRKSVECLGQPTSAGNLRLRSSTDAVMLKLEVCG